MSAPACTTFSHEHREATREVWFPALEKWVPYCTSCATRQRDRNGYETRPLAAPSPDPEGGE